MKKQLGLTLIELVVTVAMIAIILAVGIPMLNDFSGSNRRTAQLNLITGTLSLARSEAIKRTQVITVCASTDQASCDTSNWESGWIMFADVDGNKATAGTFEAGDTLLRVTEALEGGNFLRLSSADSTAFVQYTSNGALRDRTSNGVVEDATFTLCPGQGTATEKQQKAIAINLNRMGQSSLALDSNSDKIVEDVDGANVTCP